MALLVSRGAAVWSLIGVLALLNVTVAFGAMFASITGVTTGVASVLSNSASLLVVLPAWWLFGERPRLLGITGVAVGFGGLVIIAAPSGGGRGAGLALLAAFGIAVGALLARRLSSIDLLVLGAWQFLLGGTVLAGIACVVEGPPTTIAWSSRFTLTLAVLALVATALPYLLWFGELRRASLTAVTTWTLLVPVVGVILGVVVLDEPITLAGVIGDVIVVAGLAVVARAARPSRAETLSATDTVDYRPLEE
ncbi:putative membrane protein (plasmid) [Nocardia farcinica IFM 10152]|uniref:Putative membrane protein n=1 Tax=Nocardia farcinica (strain IFM 10152) TaxID=247156 RepID=Q5YMN7_NOCFA|nr:putative membrane protein [Nocardia farcinica IFM 10152]